MYEDFIKGTIDSERALQVDPNKEEDPKRAAFYEVGKTKKMYDLIILDTSKAHWRISEVGQVRYQAASIL